jgi:hypothetical protein
VDWNTLDEFNVVLHLKGNHYGNLCVSRKDRTIDFYDSIPGYVDGMEIMNVCVGAYNYTNSGVGWWVV